MRCDYSVTAYQNEEGQSECKHCEAGQKGSELRIACICAEPCKPGMYRDEVMDRCLHCPESTYNPSYGAYGKKSCLTCQAGSYVDRSFTLGAMFKV